MSLLEIKKELLSEYKWKYNAFEEMALRLMEIKEHEGEIYKLIISKLSGLKMMIKALENQLQNESV